MNCMINIADTKDPDDQHGRTYREVNAEKKHRIKIGELVELESGERLFVKQHTRDCDQTPLYSLGMIACEDAEMMHGYDYDSLEPVIKGAT